MECMTLALVVSISWSVCKDSVSYRNRTYGCPLSHTLVNSKMCALTTYWLCKCCTHSVHMIPKSPIGSLHKLRSDCPIVHNRLVSSAHFSREQNKRNPCTVWRFQGELRKWNLSTVCLHLTYFTPYLHPCLLFKCPLWLVTNSMPMGKICMTIFALRAHQVVYDLQF